jgi:hypothetical protein
MNKTLTPSYMYNRTGIELVFLQQRTGVAGRVAADHLECQSQQHMSDDVLEETVSLSHLERRARHQSAQHETL